jgi:anti-anti-sigma factor
MIQFPMEFYYHELDHNVLVLRADGGLNAQTAAQFIGELEKLIDAGVQRIIVDCGGLDYVSSYGLGVLVRLHKKLAAHGGDVKLADIHSKLVQALTITHLDSLFEIYPDVNRARLAFRRPDERPQ